MFSWLREVFEDPQTEVRYPSGEPTRRENAVVRADSRNPGFVFMVSLDVRYGIRTGAAAVDDPFLVARAGVDRRVCAITRRYSLIDHARAHSEIEVALSRQQEVESTGVLAWASCLRVAVPAEAYELIRKYEELRLRETARGWERGAEEAEIKHLRRLLADPAHATAWWWRGNPEAVQQLSEVAQTFKSLRYELSENGEATDDGDSWDKIFADFDRRAGESARLLLTEQMHRILKEHDLGDLADRAGQLRADQQDD